MIVDNAIVVCVVHRLGDELFVVEGLVEPLGLDV
jgi:hypothetical protein